MTEALLAGGAAANTKTNKGTTPLHVAAAPRVVMEQLLARKADTNSEVVDPKGHSPLHLAAHNGTS